MRKSRPPTSHPRLSDTPDMDECIDSWNGRDTLDPLESPPALLNRRAFLLSRFCMSPCPFDRFAMATGALIARISSSRKAFSTCSCLLLSLLFCVEGDDGFREGCLPLGESVARIVPLREDGTGLALYGIAGLCTLALRKCGLRSNLFVPGSAVMSSLLVRDLGVLTFSCSSTFSFRSASMSRRY